MTEQRPLHFQTPSVKRQPWGQVHGKGRVVHRAGRRLKVVVGSRLRKQGFGAHGLQGPKSMMEKAKMGLSTELAALYYYDQVKRFK